MKFAVAALLGAVSAVDKDVEMSFAQYLAEYGKSYATKEEYLFRLNIFVQKVAFIAQHNAVALKEDDHFVGLNHMSDWTEAEYKRLLGFNPVKRSEEPKGLKQIENTKDVPASVDWRTQGAVTPVKN